VPAAQLAAGLGTVVNVANVADLDDGNGTRIPGTSTLAEAGLTDGSTVRVVAPGLAQGLARSLGASPHASTAPHVGTPTTHDAATHDAATHDAAAFGGAAGFGAGRGQAASRRRGVPALVAILAAAVAAVVFFVLGGVVLGSGSTPAPGPGPMARQAATAWVNARPFTGPLAPGVPARFGRVGAIASSALTSAGQWHHGNEAGETFVVVPSPQPTAGPPTAAGGTPPLTAPQIPFVLTVVTMNGKVAFPPTVSLVPAVNGRMPPAMGASKLDGPGPAPRAISVWADSQFGPTGAQVPALQLGLAGGPSVETGWNPEAGGTVYRVKVSFDSLAPGTTGGKVIDVSQAIAAKLATDTAAGQADQMAVAQAQAQARAAQQATLAANPPNPPPLQAAFAAALGAVTVATQKLNADTTVLQADRLAGAKTAPLTQGLARTSVIATYDVWMRAQNVIGWAPAAYGIAG
ncbi:MAG: hypothetical protein M3137_09090, partial [Actinomycetota bacterium]|nr:hypothetical protein [Actinomycetota bacterium]